MWIDFMLAPKPYTAKCPDVTYVVIWRYTNKKMELNY